MLGSFVTLFGLGGGALTFCIVRDGYTHFKPLTEEKLQAELTNIEQEVDRVYSTNGDHYKSLKGNIGRLRTTYSIQV